MKGPPGFFKMRCLATCGVCASKTASKTLATSPTSPPTNTPTRNPTFAPTEEETTAPLPVFDTKKKEELEAVVAAATVVVINTATATEFPTMAPTPSPTVAGYQAVTKKEQLTAVTAEVTLAVSAEQAKTPAMKKSLETGFANAVGVTPENVRVSSIGGEAQRRRLASTAIEFEITSRSAAAAQITKLQENIKTAATSGAVVANVKKAAVDNNVLTKELKEMEDVLPEPTTTQKTVEVEVVVQERPPTKSPTEYITLNAAASTRVSAAAALVGVLFVVAAY